MKRAGRANQKLKEKVTSNQGIGKWEASILMPAFGAMCFGDPYVFLGPLSNSCLLIWVESARDLTRHAEDE